MTSWMIFKSVTDWLTAISRVTFATKICPVDCSVQCKPLTWLSLVSWDSELSYWLTNHRAQQIFWIINLRRFVLLSLSWPVFLRWDGSRGAPSLSSSPIPEERISITIPTVEIIRRLLLRWAGTASGLRAEGHAVKLVVRGGGKGNIDQWWPQSVSGHHN